MKSTTQTLATPLTQPDRLGLARAAAQRLQPLWRHAVFLVALVSLLGIAAAIRLDVQQLRKDLDRNGHAQREALIQRDRLRLEVDARRRAMAMESAAVSMDMAHDVRVVRLGGR